MMKWISVDDRLPDKDGWYLWFNIDSEMSVEYYYDNKLPYKVSHWMPLPDPPEDK